MKGDERMLVAGKESEEETVKVVKGDHEKRLEDGRERISEAVSYTHLDVYKRQVI